MASKQPQPASRPPADNGARWPELTEGLPCCQWADCQALALTIFSEPAAPAPPPKPDRGR